MSTFPAEAGGLSQILSQERVRTHQAEEHCGWWRVPTSDLIYKMEATDVEDVGMLQVTQRDRCATEQRNWRL